MILLVAVYYLPPVHARLAWRMRELEAHFKIWLYPPESMIFIPTQPSASMPVIPSTPWVPTATSSALSTQRFTPTPTITSTPLPEQVVLEVPRYFSQCNRWNYCGPANLAMALSFWGWKGDRDDVARAIKPGEDDPDKSFIERGKADLNVMPYEMVNFVNEQTGLSALVRYGGELSLLKNLIANGFPILIEKGYYQRDSTGRVSWMGHYAFVTGYDESRGGFIWQDAYPDHCKDTDPTIVERKGRDNLNPYADFVFGWRGFNYLFVVVYPPEQEDRVLSLLGPWRDARWAAQHALEIAEHEIRSLDGLDLFFAWFNKGTSQVQLLAYADAAASYDYAFQIYAALDEDNAVRPYRILWYQTGPYWAYYYTGRYQDVINLADITLNSVAYGPNLEESLYWKAQAQYAVGQYGEACANMRRAVYLNHSFSAGLNMLQSWGCP